MHTKLYIILLCLIACKKPADEKSDNKVSESSTEYIDTSIIRHENELKSLHTLDTTSIRLAFDKVQWNFKDGHNYKHREGMYEILMTNVEFRSLLKQGAITFLGQPDRVDGDYLFYTISQKRLGTFPVHTKTMVMQFTPNGPVEWIKIHE